MAHAVNFPGSNKVFKAPPGREDVSDLHTFFNGHAIVSAWEFTPDELAEINRTGRAFMSSFSGNTLFPVFVGSESEVRRLVADYGAVWQRQAPPTEHPLCANPLCASAAARWPVIRFGPAGHPADEPLPYRLEVPQPTCEGCVSHFQPDQFFTPEARVAMRRMLVDNGHSEPAYGRLVVTWLPFDHPWWGRLIQMGGGQQAQLWWGDENG